MLSVVLQCPRSRQASRAPGPCRQLEHKDSDKRYSGRGETETQARQQGRSFQFQQVQQCPPPDLRPGRHGSISMLLVLVFPRHPGLWYFPLQTLRRYLLPTNLNLIKCLGQPNFIYHALPTTFATRKRVHQVAKPHSASVGICRLPSCMETSFSFSPQRAIFLQHMTHAAIIGYRRAGDREPAQINLFAFGFHL